MAASYNTRRISISITTDEYRIIQAVARDDRRSVSDTIGLLISEHLTERYKEILKKDAQRVGMEVNEK